MVRVRERACSFIGKLKYLPNDLAARASHIHEYTLRLLAKLLEEEHRSWGTKLVRARTTSAPGRRVVEDPLSLLKNHSLMIHHFTYKTLSVIPVEETF